ncbi:TPA: SEF14/SEF18 fimbria chaperone SefB, partial [Salmonella enterica]|nr:SEF14/SEF18 fimbria chaperone SefB [Salmonella enterica]HCJ1187802.1 SEF14/SEF18 fimbria chaperone SefB [Salmonella enterica]
MYILNKCIRITVIFFFFCYLPIASSESKKIEQPLLTQKYYGLRLGTTRVIYKEDAPSTSFWIMNEKEYPILVQTQVYNDDKSSKAPFIVTPPILKVESNARTRLKVIPTSNLFNKNEESLYWLCVKGVPPLNDNESNNKNNITTNLNVNVVTNSCIKLIYRPKTIDLTTMEIADKLKLERKGNSIVIKNPTSSYVNIANIKSGNLSFNIPNGYIEP